MTGLTAISRARWRLIGGALAALCALLTLVGDVRLLAGDHAVGIADNCDFARVMSPSGLAHFLGPGEGAVCDTLRTDFRRYYLYAPERPWPDGPFDSIPTTMLVRAVRWLYQLSLPNRPIFDISALGLSYLTLAVGAIASFLTRSRTRIALLLAAALLAVVSDPEYIVLLNSFYAEPTAFAALVGLVCVLCRPTRTLATVSAAAVLGSLLSFTKMQLAASGAILLASMLLARLARRQAERHTVLVWVLLASLAAAPVAMLVGSGNPNAEPNRFDAIFDGVLHSTTDEQTERIMAKLQLDPALKGLAGSNFWDCADRARAIGSAKWMHVPLSSLLELYLTNPPMAAELMEASTRNLTRHDPTALSNYARDQHPADSPHDYHRRGPRISWIREQLAVLGWPWFSLFALAMLVFGVRRLSQAMPERRGCWVAFSFLLFFGLSQPLIAVLGDGYAELARHLFVARFALDLAVAIGLALAVDESARWFMATWYRRVVRVSAGTTRTSGSRSRSRRRPADRRRSRHPWPGRTNGRSHRQSPP